VDRVKPPLGATFLRLFTVQASWNYDRMIGVGVGIAEEPLLRDLRDTPGDGAAYHAAVARGARFFNAHPYLCGLAVGATARAEHDGAPPEQIERLRAALCGPLGALGDRLVWAGWLPLLSVAAVAAVAAGAGWIAVAAFLVVYNLGHVSLRWWALRTGWNSGTSVAGALGHPTLKRLLRVVGPALALVSGLALPVVSRFLVRPFALRPAVLLAAVGVAGIGLLVSRPGRITGPWLGLAAVATAVIVGVLWR
jgi:PTS system mannose-specific IID component